MRFDQYEIKKEDCCQCERPYEVSTARDYCQSCRTVIFEPTWSTYLRERLATELNKSGLDPKSIRVITKLAHDKMGRICNDSDLNRAQKVLSDIRKALEEDEKVGTSI